MVDYDSRSHLPISLAKNHIPGQAEISPEVHLSGVLSDTNTNLSPARILLLHWHCQLVHKSMIRVQSLFRAVPLLSAKFLAASRCVLHLCEYYQYDKSHKQSTNGSVKSKRENTDGDIYDGNLRAGNLVSVDHFESRLKGRTYISRSDLAAETYVGGCVFVDPMSSLLYVERQFEFFQSRKNQS